MTAGMCLVWPRACIICTKPFMARHPNTLTCSQQCSRRRANRSDDYHRWKRSKRRSVTMDSDITPQQEADMRRRARKCRICRTYMTSKPGHPNSKHLDHIIPIAIGGTHAHGNVRIICRTCNLARPKDGSDYTGPVTLWAQVPGIAITPPKVSAPKPPLKGWPIAACQCGTQFEQRSQRQQRCTTCMATLAAQAISMRKQGASWAEIAQAIGYTIAGAHLLAQRYGLYAETGRLAA